MLSFFLSFKLPDDFKNKEELVDVHMLSKRYAEEIYRIKFQMASFLKFHMERRKLLLIDLEIYLEKTKFHSFELVRKEEPIILETIKKLIQTIFKFQDSAEDFPPDFFSSDNLTLLGKVAIVTRELNRTKEIIKTGLVPFTNALKSDFTSLQDALEEDDNAQVNELWDDVEQNVVSN